jgi:hypothetical protein
MRCKLGRLGMYSVVMCLVLWGCGGDDGGGPNPVTGIDVSPGSATVVTGGSLELSVVVTGGDDDAVDWYVNDIPDGNATVGTVTVNSPATYTAPAVVPDPPTVVVKAVSRQNTRMTDTCLVTIEAPKAYVYVSASTGSDETGTGESAAPLKSITAALKIAGVGTTVLVANGVYDADNGEEFPLELPDSVSVVGESPENTVIRGHSGEGFYMGTIRIGGRNTALRKFTLQMGEPAAARWRVALLLYWSEDALVDSVRVLERADYGVIRLTDAVGTRIENCLLVIDDGQTSSHGIEFNTEYDNTVIRNCEIGGFWLGISLNNHANPLIEHCVIEGNQTGVSLCCPGLDDHDPNPDLGGGARNSAGGNTIRNNACGITNGSSNAIFAKFNTWDNAPPVEGEDFCNTGTGSVIWE